MSSGGGSQTSTTRVAYSPSEQALRDTMMNSTRADFNRDWTGQNPWGLKVDQYLGPKPVSPSGATQRSWDLSGQAANAIQGQTYGAINTNDALAQSLNVNSNPYLQEAMRAANRQVTDNFTQAGGPLAAIRSGAVGAGAYGGSRQGIAEGIALKGLNQQISDMDSKMASDAYYRGLDAANNSVNNQTKLALMQMMPGQLMSQIGANQEGYQQNLNNYQSNTDMAHLYGPYQFLQNAAGVANSNTSAANQTTSSIPKQDNTGQIAGTLGTVAMLALLSDRRFKENITRIGTHKRGIGIYCYTIFGMPRIGVMADEVEKVLPDAIINHPSGFQMVNYAML